MCDPAITVHWHHQLSLSFAVVHDYLKHLSKKEADSHDAGILDFKNKYSILFVALCAVFRMMMSNSCMCEQIHRMMRHTQRAGIGMDESDVQKAYAVDID